VGTFYPGMGWDPKKAINEIKIQILYGNEKDD